MLAAGAPAAPWDAPWFAALQPGLDLVAADAVAGRWPLVLQALNQAASAAGLHNEAGRALQFVNADAVQVDSYEAHIWRTGQVPTRLCTQGCWHDLFNALVWIAVPRIKSRLNALQASVVVRDGVRSRRGALRDAATLFDENAVLFVTADSSLAQALRRFDWRELFLLRREAFSARVQVLAFGHALIDKLRAPYKAICAHAWIIDDPWLPATDRHQASVSTARQRIDQLVCTGLDQTSLCSDAFAPLPVLGIPGWWPVNHDPAFYDDTAVFRAGRQRASAHRTITAQGD
ncbi:MAG: DUF3025 domain-containing protein [Quisquiliibacterium sp.]